MTNSQIAALSEKQFIRLFNQVISKIKENPLANFVKARGLMNFTPSHAQQVILKVIFHQKLDDVQRKVVPLEKFDSDGKFYLTYDTHMTEVEMYKYLTGVDYDEDAALNTVINNIDLICGRRSGKTTLVAIICIFFSITNNWKPYLHKTPYATVLVMSHSKEFSAEVLDIIQLFITESPILTRLLNQDRKQTASTLNLKMPFLQEGGGGMVDNSLVQIKVGAASSKTTRGIAACAVLCDEIAFWNLDEAMRETDVKILKAIRPALKQFGELGMLFKLSSPGIKQGVLYSEYVRSQKGELPHSYRVFKAPLWVMNQAIPASELSEEYAYDPEGFVVEYGAEFADSLSNFIIPEFIDHAVSVGVPRFAPDGNPEMKYRAALDAAFKSDRFTFTLVAATETRIKQFLSKTWRGSQTNPLKASEVAKWIRNATKDYPIDFIAADQFAFEPLREVFSQYDLVLQEYPFSSTYKKKIYYNLKKVIHSGQIDLLDVELQTKELKELIVEQSPSGNIKIGHPRSGSDDLADALAIATMLAVEGQGSGKFSFEDAVQILDYGIKTDQNGASFEAPSPDILVRSGHLPENVFDNSSEYGVDPADGMLKKFAYFESEVGGGDDDFEFSFG